MLGKYLFEKNKLFGSGPRGANIAEHRLQLR